LLHKPGQTRLTVSVDTDAQRGTGNLLAITTVLLFCLAGCKAQSPTQHQSNGNVKTGRHLIYSYGCGSCHVIPGITEASGTVGPPLSGFGFRRYIAGVLLNQPENLVKWITKPQQVIPQNAMPDMGVAPGQARDMAAYLYTLR
jgi:cytochrome c2